MYMAMIDGYADLTPFEMRRKHQFGYYLLFAYFLIPLVYGLTLIAFYPEAGMLILGFTPFLAVPALPLYYFYSYEKHGTGFLTCSITLSCLGIAWDFVISFPAILAFIHNVKDYINVPISHFATVMAIFVAIMGPRLFHLWIFHRTRRLNKMLQFRLGSSELYKQWSEKLLDSKTSQEVDSRVYDFCQEYPRHATEARRMADIRKEQLSSASPDPFQ